MDGWKSSFRDRMMKFLQWPSLKLAVAPFDQGTPTGRKELTSGQKRVLPCGTTYWH